jgi:hypothetical protein
MRPYVIRQGDYLTRLAHSMGFDADAVWNHAYNRELRERRPNREILAPGDILYIPDAAPEARTLNVGSNNRFRATVGRVTIDIVLRGHEGPLANEPYVVEGLTARITGQSDGAGRVTIPVPITAREVRLTLPRRHVTMPVAIGGIDPHDEPSGARQRLEHLGHFGSQYAPIEGLEAAAGEIGAREQRAVERFQRSRGLPASGALDDATRAALAEAHDG